MSDHPESRLVLIATERKKQLITESSLRRRQVVEAQQAIQTGLQLESLTRGVLGKAAQLAVALVFGKASIGNRAGLPPWLPVVLSSAAALSRSSALKPVLRKVVLAATLGALAAAFARKAYIGRAARRGQHLPK